MFLKKALSSLLSLGFAAALLLPTTSADAEVVKVFLLGGQSNMVGKGKTAELPVALQAPQDDVLFFWGQGNGTVNDPLVTSGLTTLQPGSGGTINEFGPEVTFGQTVADAFPDESFALIKYAAEGTNLHINWGAPGGSFYREFRNTVSSGLDALVAAGHTPVIVGMLWYQGAADAKLNRTTEQYEFDLNEFIADLRTNHYGQDLPFFLARLSSGSPLLPDQLANIRTAQENVAAADPLAYLIDADSLTFGSNEHINAAGQMELGQRFAQAYIATAPEPSTLALVVTMALLTLRRRRLP
ncbi:MAG: sialate O-acetylesterase [Phycisphaeraceae bacterium]